MTFWVEKCLLIRYTAHPPALVLSETLFFGEKGFVSVENINNILSEIGL